MNFTIELEQEVDGRWIADVVALPEGDGLRADSRRSHCQSSGTCSACSCRQAELR
jgi:hypothetical protein